MTYAQLSAKYQVAYGSVGRMLDLARGAAQAQETYQNEGADSE